MQTPIDLLAQRQQEMAEQAAASERARQQNLRVFEAMWLTLGRDVLLLDGNRHDAELAEARGLAVFRWNQLINIEQQVIREEQALAARPKKRPSAPGDDLVPDRTLAERDRAFEEESKGRRDGLEVLKAQAKHERASLRVMSRRRGGE
jgi:hypothetical protein